MAYPQRPPPQRQPPPMRSYGRPPPGPAPADGYYDYGYDDGYQYGDAGYGDGYGYYGGGGGGSGGGADYATPRSYGPPRGAPRPPRGPPPMDHGGYGYPPRGYGSSSSSSSSNRRPPPPGRGGMRPGPRRPPPSDRSPYDNPYPHFPGRGRPRKGSVPPPVERGMAAMNINGPPPRGVPDRPHTSNGRRPGPPPDSPGRGRGPYPGPAMRSASAGRPAPTRPYDRSYTDANGPPPMPMAPINRSATAPLEIAGPMHGEPAGDSHDTDDLLDSYYGSAPDDPDMPNFDAMPDAKSGPVDESLPGLEGPRPAPKTPTESKPPGGQYAAFTPHSAGSHSAPVSPDTNPPNQFANAGFQFDLPNEPHTMSPGDDRSGYSYNSPPEAYGESVPGYPFPHRQDSHNNTMPGYSAAGGGPPRPYRMNQPAMANEMEAVDPQQNPDALPHHPVPFRPGHDGGKPAPVRQYAGAPNGPTSPTSTSASPQQDMGPFAKPVTRQELEELQLAVKKKSSNQATHLLLAQKLVEAATVLVDEAHLDAKGKTKAREKYVMDAYKIVKKLVSSGYGDAQFYLADCYGQGQLGLEVDNKEAYNLYHSAAKSGHAQAAYRVAVCCEIGHEEGGGTKRDPFKAVQWYKRAASLGDPPAMYKMGMIMLKGLLGQTKNPREGVTWLKRAAEKADVENPHALHELALMYANASPNDIVVRDEEYAKQLFCQAGELGYKFSQFRLAAAYEYGLMGCPVDPRQSIIWYTHAAAQGEHQSELALSGWYLTGSEGILQQSDTEAYLWARKAATAGLAKAEYAMGYFTEVGIGVTANLDDAKRWYWRAAAQGFPKARERLEELKKGGSRMQKTRLSRSAVNRQNPNEGDCVVM